MEAPRCWFTKLKQLCELLLWLINYLLCFLKEIPGRSSVARQLGSGPDVSDLVDFLHRVHSLRGPITPLIPRLGFLQELGPGWSTQRWSRPKEQSTGGRVCSRGRRPSSPGALFHSVDPPHPPHTLASGLVTLGGVPMPLARSHRLRRETAMLAWATQAVRTSATVTTGRSVKWPAQFTTTLTETIAASPQHAV